MRIYGLAHLFLGRAHVCPASLTFLLNSTLGSLRTQVIRDDRAGMLHVEEVWCQWTLRGVGIMSSLLAFLLLLNWRSQVGNGHDQLSGGILEVGENVSLGAFGGGFTEQKVCLADVVRCK